MEQRRFREWRSGYQQSHRLVRVDVEVALYDTFHLANVLRARLLALCLALCENAEARSRSLYTVVVVVVVRVRRWKPPPSLEVDPAVALAADAAESHGEVLMEQTQRRFFKCSPAVYS